MINYALNRFKEASTYLGLGMLGTGAALHCQGSGEWTIEEVALEILGFLLALWKEKS